MVWSITGIILGVIIGLNITYSIPVEYIKYSAVIIVGILDSLLGAIRAEVTHDEKYNNILFLSGLLFNILIALSITLLGEQLGLDLYLAVSVGFIFRIFTNMGAIRRALVKKLFPKKRA